MAYSFRVAPQDRIEQGNWLYVSPTRPPRSSLEHWSAPSSYFWMYNGQGDTLEVSDKYGLDNQATAVALTFPTDSVIEIGNKRYEFYCIAQLHENTPELNGYTNQNVATIYTYDGGLAYYFYTKIYRLASAYIRIDFNAAGGTVSPSYTEGWGGDTITLPTPTYANHSFKGWYYGDTRVGGAGDTWVIPFSTSDITLTAHWSIYETGVIRAVCIHQIYQIGTYTYTQDDEEETASLTWNITTTTITEAGRVFQFGKLRITYYPFDEVLPETWETSQTSGTFDRTSVYPRPVNMARPPDACMRYWDNSLLHTRISYDFRLIYSRSTGALCYGPTQLTPWYPGRGT